MLLEMKKKLYIRIRVFTPNLEQDFSTPIPDLTEFSGSWSEMLAVPYQYGLL